MQKCYRGLAAALLCVVLMAGGCGKEEAAYTSGVSAVQLITEETKQPDSEISQEQNTEEQVRRYVYVCGAVNDPGVYPIEENMRVFEAVALAGGFNEQADTQWGNQAESVHDGQKLYIYTKEETSQMESEAAAQSRSSGENSDGRVNINEASRDLLMTLPGIGESKADAVIQYRNEHGVFGSIEEIQNVPGIKNAVFQNIKDHITVDS